MANLPSARGFSRENRPPDPAALNHANPHCTLPGKYSWIPVIFVSLDHSKLQGFTSDGNLRNAADFGRNNGPPKCH
jgi:hypothetical protein